MIEVAARATNEVNIPNRKATREEILDMFKNQMSRLKERLNVCQVLLLMLSYYLLQPCSESSCDGRDQLDL